VGPFRLKVSPGTPYLVIDVQAGGGFAITVPIPRPINNTTTNRAWINLNFDMWFLSSSILS
jgi:hypothetical protein